MAIKKHLSKSKARDKRNQPLVTRLCLVTQCLAGFARGAIIRFGDLPPVALLKCAYHLAIRNLQRAAGPFFNCKSRLRTQIERVVEGTGDAQPAFLLAQFQFNDVYSISHYHGGLR